MTNVTNIHPRAHIPTNQHTHIPYLNGKFTCRTIKNASSTEVPCGNTGRKKVPKSLWSENENGYGSTNYSAWVCNGNNIQGNMWGNGIPLPNQTHQQRNSITMDNIICKWDWKLRTRRWWMRQSNQHNIIHKTRGYVGVPKIDLCLQCGGLSTIERIPILNMPHSWRKFNQLPRWRCTYHGRNAYI